MDDFDSKKTNDEYAASAGPGTDDKEYSDYQDVDETGGDNLMDTIGIDLEETTDITVDDSMAATPDFVDENFDLDKAAVNISRSVLIKLGEKINTLLIDAIEEAVAEEMEKLKQSLNL